MPLSRIGLHQSSPSKDGSPPAPGDGPGDLPGGTVKVRHLVVAGVAAALALSGCGSSSGNNSSSTGGGKKTLKVWLMNGSAPQSVVDAVNAEFNKAHPNVDVKVELQQWDGIVEKVSTALASDTPPDVLEMGNTQDLKFAA